MTGREMIESSANTGSADKREAWMKSVARLMRIASGDTGQCRRAADFLLAWHDAEENGGWDPTDLWNVDAAIAEDMLTALRFLRTENRYPGDLGFQKEIDRIWELWRAGKRGSGRSS
jgi:hypothetical protein